MTILNVNLMNLNIIQKNIGYAAFMLWGVVGSFLSIMMSDTVAAMPRFSWECALYCDLFGLMFAIVTAVFAFKFIRNHDELKALVKNQEETS